MNCLHRALYPFLCLAMAPWGVLGATIFVDNRAGDDARDGTSAEQALRTLRRAVPLCQPGDTLRIANTGEPYRESLAFGTRGGTPSAPILVEGQGAVLSGLLPIPADAWTARGDGLFFHANGLRAVQTAARPFLVRDGAMVPRRAKPAEVGAEESCWDADGIYFRVAPGRAIGDYRLEGTMLMAGLVLTGGSYIEVRDLVCEHFANDGFNIHGSCQGLVFRNIVGRWNGDDGFSVHEDVGSVVLGGHFHHNDYGIQDINISRSSFYGVLSENNRQAGADFMGGYHALVDCVVRDNAVAQIRCAADGTRHMRPPTSLLARGVLFARNTLAVGGRTGLHVRSGFADVVNCTFAAAEEGVRVEPDATLSLRASAVFGCRSIELACASATSALVGNAYSPGRMHWGGRQFAPDSFAAYQELSGQDAGSAAVPSPAFVRKDGFSLLLPMLVVESSQIRPGIVGDLSFPFGEPVANPLATEAAVLPALLGFDFENTNPWSRVYPSPEKAKDGQAVVGTAALSDEKCHSGKQSMKLDVSFPAGRPGPWLVKLFSVKLPVEKPVVELRFALFGDASGLAYQPRLRDQSGECFYGPAGKLDWQGWREIVWNLRQTPPDPITGGDGNRQQDVPTLEVVLELTPVVPADGGRITVFADDLRIRLAE